MKNSIKLLAFAFALLLSGTLSTSKAQIFNKGDFDLNAQIGFGTAWYYSSFYKASLPFISVAGDYALIDEWGPGVFGVGAILGINTLKYDYYWGIGSDEYKNTNISIAPRATYHYSFVDKLDTYAGIASGIKIRTYSGDYVGSSVSNDVAFIFTAFAGAKYFFTDNFAVMSEIYVYDLAIFNIGVSFKFNK
jgi:hypothetical protein